MAASVCCVVVVGRVVTDDAPQTVLAYVSLSKAHGLVNVNFFHTIRTDRLPAYRRLMRDYRYTFRTP